MKRTKIKILSKQQNKIILHRSDPILEKVTKD